MGQSTVFLLISSLFITAHAADTCLSKPELLGLLFASVGATFLICAALAVILYICFRKPGIEKVTYEKSAYANDVCDVEDKGVDAPKIIQKDKISMIESFKVRRKLEDVGTQKAYSMEFLNEVDGKIGVHLSGEDVGGLGFNIQGNMNEGIFIKEVISKGIAEQCGNIFIGDRIKSLTINFENMVYEDAVTLLSYASPYKVKIELERKLSDNSSSCESDDEKEMRYHPLFRSNTLTHVHFNPLGSVSSSPKSKRRDGEKVNESINDIEKQSSVEPDSTVVEDTSAVDGDNSRMESSDYGSDGTSECRQSTSSDGTQKTLSDRIEITDIIFDKVTSPIPPVCVKAERCVELPAKKKIVPRSPSPKHKPPPSPKVNRSTSTAKVAIVEDSTQTRQKVAETKPTQTEQGGPPVPPPVSSIPVRKEMETQTAKAAVATVSTVVQTDTKTVTSSTDSVKEESKNEVSKAPEIMEARISRIPKRADGVKTPVIERKLPSLPKSVTQRSHSADKNDNVWSRLYQEKKGQLRKTREFSSPPTTHSGTPPKPNSGLKNTEKSSGDEKYGTLTRDKRDRLIANDAELERQKEELRKLGVL